MDSPKILFASGVTALGILHSYVCDVSPLLVICFVIFSALFIPVQEKDREKKDKEKDVKEKDKKAINGHLFAPISSGQATQCSQCNKTFNNKECYHCSRKPFCLFYPFCSCSFSDFSRLLFLLLFISSFVLFICLIG